MKQQNCFTNEIIFLSGSFLRNDYCILVKLFPGYLCGKTEFSDKREISVNIRQNVIASTFYLTCIQFLV